ncbi:acyltransferase family protein [Nocardioides sp. URHA0020]|uniref:acyltransferase family protein n=1 Tax=Nocardioides sp. URHA0020 TaxID=1380392 RepID=UPI000684F536|nr:acyltransferase family protein [Nocardioides sp. URHA0020]
MTDQSTQRRESRADIQALRALAVGLVVFYHLFPTRLTGGFIGVDTFFVISGFLITLHLIERPPRGAHDLVAFWARRARRLLPASLTVLAATLCAAWLFLPETQWETTAVHTRAAALYVENWQLAADAVDYLASENDPSAVQHFWSLGVEEQFYLGWPVLLLALTALVPAAHRVRGYWWGLGAVVVVSLGYSVHLTSTEPAAAYFVTWTRLWELGVGGLLALAAPAARRWAEPRPRGATAVAVAGWCLILATAVLYTDRTPFPGWAAALPVVGAGLVIAAHSRMRWYRLRGVQWLGDVSYAVYLWHWPLIVILPVALSKVAGSPERGPLDTLLILIATLVLAGLTKVYVEDRFRTPAWSRRVRPSLVSGAVGMAVVVALTLSLGATVSAHERADRTALAAALDGSDPCAGAGVLDPATSCPPNDNRSLVLSPLLASDDWSDAYDERSDGSTCISPGPGFALDTCTFGDPDGTVDVALFGNSHAAQWLPALQAIAERRHWRITTYLASKCTAADLRQYFDEKGATAGCIGWTRAVAAAIAESRPDLVVFTNRTGRPALGETSLEESAPKYTVGFRRTLDALTTTGVPVVVIRDTPIPIQGGLDDVPACLALHGDDPDACSGPRDVWESGDPSIAAARQLADRGVSIADLTDSLCDTTTCWSAIGGVVVYADGHHLTNTYARTVAPRLEPFLLKALGKG